MYESAPHPVVHQDLQPLPGEDRCEERLLHQAVAELNHIYTRSGLETARRVGQYLLTTFFNGDLRAFHNRYRRHVTFRKLAEQSELRLSYSFLWYAVAVVGQLEAMPREIGNALPLAHHRLLLPVRDPELKLRLAKEAVNRGLSKRELEQLIKARTSPKAGETRRGRPPLPSFVKGINRLKQAMALATEQEITADSFRHYSPEDGKRLLAELYTQISQADQLAEALRSALQQTEPAELRL